MNFWFAGSELFKLMINCAMGISQEMKSPFVAFTMISTDFLLKSKLYARELAGLKLESNSTHPENPSVLRARFD